MGDPPTRTRTLAWVVLAAALVVGSFCSAADSASSKERLVAVVGAGECADCASKNIKNSDAFKGLHVAINCKAVKGEYQIRGVGKLDENGKFNVDLPSELVKDDGKLKEECFAQLHGGSKNAPCPGAHDGPDASKLVLKSRDGDKHTFGTAGKLRFSSETCASAWWWKHPWYYKPLPPMTTYPYPPKPYYFPPIYKPIYKPPLTPPVYQSPPVYTPTPVPVYSPPPVYKPSPVYSPPPVYKPPPVYSPPPVYKPPPVYSAPPVYKPPPVYSPPPVYKPPVYQPPAPVYNQPPVYLPPMYKPPCPPFPPITFPPVYKKPWPPLPQLPPKYFFTHPKFGSPPSYGWPPMPKNNPSTTYSTPKHPFFPPKKAGDLKP